MPRCDLPNHRGVNPLLHVREIRIRRDDLQRILIRGSGGRPDRHRRNGRRDDGRYLPMRLQHSQTGMSVSRGLSINRQECLFHVVGHSQTGMSVSLSRCSGAETAYC